MQQQPHSAPQRVERRAFTIKRFCEVFDLSRATTNRLLKSGELCRMKAGRRTLIDAASIEAWADRARRGAQS